tara:strand:+ start:332 stop:562 length:231 start_codon:yes stop_codon:yes gene_type:complete
MSDINKIGHVVRIEKHTLDLLSVIKKNTGIPKYKAIDIAVNFFFGQNEELQKLIKLNYEVQVATENLNKAIKEVEQ